MNLPVTSNPLDREFFSRHPVEVARDLVGCVLVNRQRPDEAAFAIVECEAYGGDQDLASHASVYRKSRGHIMRRQPGHIYVYLSYGIHLCLNIVAHEPEMSGAVLIRALEHLGPENGVDPKAGSGPGKVTRLLGTTREWDDRDVVAGDIISVHPRLLQVEPESSTRIGITRDADKPWRFYAGCSQAVSGRRRTAGPGAGRP